MAVRSEVLEFRRPAYVEQPWLYAADLVDEAIRTTWRRMHFARHQAFVWRNHSNGRAYQAMAEVRRDELRTLIAIRRAGRGMRP